MAHPFPIGITFVETFLNSEKENARQLIRHEMESMIDPLVDSLFGQLKDKFVMHYVETSSSIDCFHQEPQLEHDRGVYEHLIQDHETISNAQQYHCESFDNAIDLNHPIDSSNCQPNSTNHHQSRLMSIKDEINVDPSMNVQFEPQLNHDDSINASSSSTHESINSSTSINDQSLSNTQRHPQQFAHIKHNQFDDDEDEECDCDKCVDGGIEVKEEEDDDDDDDQIDDKSSRPMKKQRIDTTQPNSTIHIMEQVDCEHEGDNGQTIEDGHRQLLNTQFELNSQSTDTINSNSIVIQQKESDTNGEESIATESNPIQPNLAQPNRQFQCPHCHKSFAIRSKFERHLRVHTGERPFQCDQCRKRFNDKSNLNKHLLIHQNVKGFQCHVCDNQFTRKDNLDTHLRLHSRKSI